MGYLLLLAFAAALVVAVYRHNYRPCPHCFGSIPKAASVCSHCGRDVPVSASSSTPTTLKARPWLVAAAVAVIIAWAIFSVVT